MTQWRHFLIFTHKRSGSIRPKGAQTGSQQAVQIFPRRESSPPGVDRLAFGFRILDPMRHEASGQQVEVSLTSNGMALHHHGRLARRDVPTWCHVRKRVHRAHHTGEGIGRGVGRQNGRTWRQVMSVCESELFPLPLLLRAAMLADDICSLSDFRWSGFAGGAATQFRISQFWHSVCQLFY